ncbi:MAG: hypothetical protein ACPGED_08445 [Flavobacteriales bacterium]
MKKIKEIEALFRKSYGNGEIHKIAINLKGAGTLIGKADLSSFNDVFTMKVLGPNGYETREIKQAAIESICVWWKDELIPFH